MDKDGYKILQNFYERLGKLSVSEKRKIESMAKNGTFGGAAWAYFQNKRYSPYKKQKSKTPPKKSQTPGKKRVSKRVGATIQQPKEIPKKRSVRKTSPAIGARMPYVKELRPGIRTILFKTSKNDYKSI